MVCGAIRVFPAQTRVDSRGRWECAGSYGGCLGERARLGRRAHAREDTVGFGGQCGGFFEDGAASVVPRGAAQPAALDALSRNGRGDGFVWRSGLLQGRCAERRDSVKRIGWGLAFDPRHLGDVGHGGSRPVDPGRSFPKTQYFTPPMFSPNLFECNDKNRRSISSAADDSLH